MCRGDSRAKFVEGSTLGDTRLIITARELIRNGGGKFRGRGRTRKDRSKKDSTNSLRAA